MDVFFSCPVSNEDLSGILRTIFLFLESLKFVKTCEVLKKESSNFGFDVSFKEEVKKRDSSSSEKAVDSSVFETSEEINSNTVKVFYSNAPGFKNSSDKSVCDAPKRNKKSAGTCHPSCETVGIQYDESHFASKTPGDGYENSAVCGIPQNGSGENRMTLDYGKIWAFDDMLEKFKALQIEHVKLMGITAELVKALQSSISGQSERFYHLREKCKEVYPDLFLLMQNNDELMPKQENNEIKVVSDAEVLYLTVKPRASQINLEIKRSVSDTCLGSKTFEEAKIERKESSKSLEDVVFNAEAASRSEEKQDDEQTNNVQKEPTNDFFDIDYGKLKSDLINGDDVKKMLILQALRWRITKQSQEVRENVMASYIRHDLLCLQAPFREKLVFLEALYCPKNPTVPNPVQESIARLVNTFASLSAGRDYLCQHDNLLTFLLLPLILNKHPSLTKLSTITRDMLLATLQKLSLRFHARQKMISSGLTEHLINFLNENHANVSVYCLEYCTAMMMNLCLHKEGRSRCMARSRDVMRLIKNLLNSKHANNIMPYVTGTMYSLLGNRKINMEAKLMDLASLLRQHIKQSDGDNKRQLEYILQIHLEGGSIKHPDPKMEGEELDLLEPELEENDIVKGDVCGEQILQDYKVQESNVPVPVPVPVIQDDPFRNMPTTPRPRSLSARTDFTEKPQPNCPHPSKCTIMEDVKGEKVEEPLAAAETVDVQPPASPAESFSEVTKQYYHKPSKKKGIFDKRKLRFPKTPYQQFFDFQNGIRNAEARTSNDQSYSCSCGYRTCEYGHQNSNKYTCCCYEAMKAFIENATVKERCDSCCQTSASTREEVAPKGEGAERNDKEPTIQGKLCNVMLEVQTDSGSCNKACVIEGGEKCCKCYNVIFQSRPRIVRTPP